MNAVANYCNGFSFFAVSVPASVKDCSVLLPDTGYRRGSLLAFPAYLAMLLHRLLGNTDLALVGYNAGPTRVAEYGGVPPYSKRYVAKMRGLDG